MSLPENLNFTNLQALKNITHCPLCKHKYDFLQANLVADKEDAYLIYINCQNCQNSMLVALSSQGPTLSSIAMVTDLKKEDLSSLKNLSLIKEDDILEVHKLFNNKDLINQLIGG